MVFVTNGEYKVILDDKGMFKCITVGTIAGVKVTIHSDNTLLMKKGEEFLIGPRGELYHRIY